MEFENNIPIYIQVINQIKRILLQESFQWV